MVKKKTDQEQASASYAEILELVEGNLKLLQENPTMDLDEVLNRVESSYQNIKILRERLSSYEMRFEELKKES